MVNVSDYDLALSLYNPSTYNDLQNGQLSLNYCDFASDIAYGTVAYGKTFGRFHTAAGLQYLNYGRFTGADATSEKTGNFTAGEYALTVGAAQKKDSVFSVGANLKFVYGGLYLQQSLALGADISASYTNRQHLLHSSILARNIGAELLPFSSGNRRSLPLVLEAGLSKGFAHMPLRLGFVLTNLERPDLSFIPPEERTFVDPVTGQIQERKVSFGKKILLHSIYQAEFIITKYFNLRFAYHFRRRDELSLETRRGMSGFSFGAGFKVGAFIINYSRSTYHLAGSGNYFSLAFHPAQFKKKSGTSSHAGH